MDEDKREKVRMASDALFSGSRFISLAHLSLEKDLEIFRARERAKLTVLDLTEKDKRFLKEMKVAY